LLKDVAEFRGIKLRRNLLRVDAVRLSELLLCLAAGVFHDSNRTMTFVLSAIGITTFLAGGIWEYFLKCKAQTN
jgi:hypothetical protein